MHFGNYISTHQAKKIVEEGIDEITVTKTTLKQTSAETISFLELNGVFVKKLERTGRPRKLDKKEIERILAMRKSSRLSFKEIGDLTDVAKSTVYDYCNRKNGNILEEEKISSIQQEMAQSMFKLLLKKDLCDEVNELAEKGLVTTNVEEMEHLMGEIEDIVL
ncbi:MAG: helix-turn-helix domain-containing protein [Candidatus Hydrothermarchaeales archaeon]